MPGSTFEDFDVLGEKLTPSVELFRRVREADNVLGSYHRATDLLAEALQNAADAVDAAKGKKDRRIRIDFDARERRFSVADNGVGLSWRDIGTVFLPSVTHKAGPAAVTSAVQRGEKGVGLSFLMFASNQVGVRTCNGKKRTDVEIRNSYAWANSEEQARLESVRREQPADTYLSSSTYTVVTFGDVDPAGRLDRDLFEMSLDEVVWVLRTQTAIGNTATVFESIGHPQPLPIKVTLRYRAAGKGKAPRRAASAPLHGEVFEEKLTKNNAKKANVSVVDIPYRYATPEDLLERAAQLGVIKPVVVHDAEEVAKLSPKDMRALLADSAVNYLARYGDGDDSDISTYFFAMEGNTFRSILSRMLEHEDVSWVPGQDSWLPWNGFWVASRDMPTGIALRGGVLPTRGYEQRTFGLLQRDNLKLDLGRKSLAGGYARAFNSVIRQAWTEDLSEVIERIPRSRASRGPSRLEFERRTRQAQALKDLSAPIPFAKQPDRASSVAAIFHELIGAGDARVPALKPITTAVFNDQDALAVNGKPDKPMHLVFAMNQDDLHRTFDRDSQDSAEMVDMAVLWRLVSSRNPKVQQIEIDEAGDDGPAGATHVMRFEGLGGRERPLYVLVLSAVLESD